jgi:rare lipoprotein A (peptidoglycan hydrolase)
MQSRLFFTWAAFRWFFLMFVVASSLEAPAIANTSQPVKPIRVWEGKASWYGPRFHGRTTANGEKYDMFGPTAAHRTLPMGSIVRVVNKKTGKGRIVRINDRGPFIDGREIDVSYHVASTLGFAENGLARVRIELLQVPERRWPKKTAAN